MFCVINTDLYLDTQSYVEINGPECFVLDPKTLSISSAKLVVYGSGSLGLTNTSISNGAVFEIHTQDLFTPDSDFTSEGATIDFTAFQALNPKIFPATSRLGNTVVDYYINN